VNTQPRTLTAEEAVAEAQAAEVEVPHTEDAEGNEVLQRPISLKDPIHTPKAPGKRVKVYHKRRTTLHLTDCKLGPEAEGFILESDAQLPQVAPHIVRMADV
jgi:hypothetical protein